jgi:hypothetical protein
VDVVESPDGGVGVGFKLQDPLDLVRLLWRPVLVTGVIVGLLSLCISYVVTPIYRAQAVLEYYGDPTKQIASQSGVSGLGGFASLAGISLGSEGSQKEASIALLRSRGFASDFISSNGLITELNRSNWDIDKNAWIEEPSLWQTVDRFHANVLRVFVDPKNGLVNLSVEWDDPILASEWATNIVAMINLRLKKNSIQETNRSLEHLKSQLESTQNKELQRVIAGLTESKIEALMFADIRDEFAFRTIDPAVAPPDDEYVSPSHITYLLLGAFFGGMFGAFLGLALAIVGSGRGWKNLRLLGQ